MQLSSKSTYEYFTDFKSIVSLQVVFVSANSYNSYAYEYLSSNIISSDVKTVSSVHTMYIIFLFAISQYCM